MDHFDRRGVAWICLYLVVCTTAGLAVGGQSAATRALLLLGALAAVVIVLARPSAGPILAAAMVSLATISPSMWLQRGGLVLSVVAVFAGWRKASDEQRRVAVLFLALAAWGVLAGWAVADKNAHQTSLMLQFLFSVVLGASVAIAAPRPVWLLLALAWPPFSAAVYLAQHPEVVVSRGDALHLGENANSLGALSGLVVVVAIGTLLINPKWAVPTVAMCMVAGAGVLNSGSRGAVIVALLGGAACLVGRFWRGSIGRSLGAIGLLGFLGLQFGQTILATALERAGRSVGVAEGFDERGRILKFALQLGFDHPVAGVGFATLEELSGASFGVGRRLSAHNTFAGVFAALGVPGLILLAVIFYLALLRSSTRSPEILFPLTLVALAMSASIEWHVTQLLGPILFVCLALAASFAPQRGRAELEELVSGAKVER